MQFIHPKLDSWLDSLSANSTSPLADLVLDRDGVINQQNFYYISSIDRFQYEHGSLAALAELIRCGFCVSIASNQSGIAKGVFSYDTVKAMHTKLEDDLGSHLLNGKKHFSARRESQTARPSTTSRKPIAHFAVCPHQESDGCLCRKPKTDLFRQIEIKLQRKLTGAPFIGDSVRDLLAAVRYSLLPVLVLTGNGQSSYQTLFKQKNSKLEGVDNVNELCSQVSVFSSLAHFASYSARRLGATLA